MFSLCPNSMEELLRRGWALWGKHAQWPRHWRLCSPNPTGCKYYWELIWTIVFPWSLRSLSLGVVLPSTVCIVSRLLWFYLSVMFQEVFVKIENCQTAYQIEFEKRPLGKGQTKYSKWSAIQSISWAECLSRLGFTSKLSLRRIWACFPADWGWGEEEEASLKEQRKSHSFYLTQLSAETCLQKWLAK